MSPCLRGENGRRAFTLVELLVVIVIIAILAGLITAAAIPAIRAARQMTIVGEISELGMAMERYKQERGDYPPDFTGLRSLNPAVVAATQQAVLRHVRTAFPRYRPGPRSFTGTPPDTRSEWDKFREDVLVSCGVDVNLLDPASALTFWLAGPSTRGGTVPMAGFSADPANPFQINEDSNGNGTLDTNLDLDGDGQADDDEDLDGDNEIDSGGSRLEPFFEFNQDRLVLAAGMYYYQPPHVQNPDDGVAEEPYIDFYAPPYVYFRARSNNQYDPTVQQFAWPNPWLSAYSVNWCLPYLKNYVTATPSTSQWFNPSTFQIVCCGLDGFYAEEEKENDGTKKIWNDLSDPPPQPDVYYRRSQEDGQEGSGNLRPEEDDNLTNFSKSALGDWNEGK